MRIRFLLLPLLAWARSAAAQIVVIDNVNVVEVDRGAVRPGLTVLLSANPLADIGNIRSIVTVIANGRVFDAAARRKILDAAAARATRPRGR